jgi:protein-disulfide isomerase
MEKTNVLPGLLVVGVCVAGVVLIALFGKGASAPDAVQQFMLEVPVRESDHVLGSLSAPVVIVEYADFQCPTCQMVSPLLHQLVEEGEGKVAVVFRYFPLPQHEHAIPAARAAEAAGLQGKFWEMHDTLFENQATWEKNTNPATVFGEYARQMRNVIVSPIRQLCF